MAHNEDDIRIIAEDVAYKIAADLIEAYKLEVQDEIKSLELKIENLSDKVWQRNPMEGD
jgi:hypothetical protein